MRCVIRHPRYIEGEFYDARPEAPLIVEIPDKYLSKDAKGNPVLDPVRDVNLERYTGNAPAKPEPLKPHYAEAKKGRPMTLGPGAAPVPVPVDATKRAADTEAL